MLITLAKVALFVALALVVGTRFVPWLLMQVTRTGSRELFTLSVLAIALGIAYGSSAAFGVSFALGAFFAGAILSESELAHQAGNDSLPLKDAFAVLFFVSVGMLFDPMVLVREPGAIVAVPSSWSENPSPRSPSCCGQPGRSMTRGGVSQSESTRRR